MMMWWFFDVVVDLSALIKRSKDVCGVCKMYTSGDLF